MENTQLWFQLTLILGGAAVLLMALASIRSAQRIARLGPGRRVQPWFVLGFLLMLPLIAVPAYLFFPTRVLDRQAERDNNRGPLVVVNLDANWYMKKRYVSQAHFRQQLADFMQGIALKADGTPAPGDYRVRQFHDGLVGQLQDFAFRGSGKRLDAAGIRRNLEAYAANLSREKVDREVFTGAMYAQLKYGSVANIEGFLSLQQLIREARAYAAGAGAEYRRQTDDTKVDIYVVTLSMKAEIATGLNGAAAPGREVASANVSGGQTVYAYFMLDENGFLPPGERERLKALRERMDRTEHPLRLDKFNITFDLDTAEKGTMASLLLAAGALALVGVTMFRGIRIRG
jgi:hypothetical protein